MAGGSGILSVPSEHLPGLVALILFPVAAWLAVSGVRAGSNRGIKALVALEGRLAATSPAARVALAAMLIGAAVHAAIVPTHWGDSRLLAVLFAADAVGFLAASVWLLIGGRLWRIGALAMLAGTVGGYVLYLLMGWESADAVGLVTTGIELAAALVLAVPAGATSPVPSRRRWVMVAAVPVAAVAILGTADLAAVTTAGAGPSPAGGALSLATTSPAGPIVWPLPMGTMEPGMQMVTPDCTTAPSAGQRAAAVALVDRTTAAAAPFKSLAAATAAGYVPVTPPGRAVVHYVKPALINDGHSLDPGAIQSLVYANTAHGAVLVAAMYLMGSDQVGATPPMPGGCLTEWHVHTNLCFSDASGVVVGTTREGPCPAGSSTHVSQPMLHVWMAPITGGPLAVDASNAEVAQVAAAVPPPDPLNATA